MALFTRTILISLKNSSRHDQKPDAAPPCTQGQIYCLNEQNNHLFWPSTETTPRIWTGWTGPHSTLTFSSMQLAPHANVNENRGTLWLNIYYPCLPDTIFPLKLNSSVHIVNCGSLYLLHFTLTFLSYYVPSNWNNQAVQALLCMPVFLLSVWALWEIPLWTC